MTVICADYYPIMLSGLLENASRVLLGVVIVAFKKVGDALWLKQ